MIIVTWSGRPRGRRQLIFVIHNSNIVVNGDADKIVVLKSDEPVMPPDPNAPKIQIDEDCGEGYAATNHEKAGSTIAAAGDCKWWQRASWVRVHARQRRSLLD
jgi:hypothetical protein